MHRILAVLAMVLLPGPWLLPQEPSQPEIAHAESVRGQAVIIRDRKVADLKTGDALRANDIVQTGMRGRVQIKLKDGSTLSVSQRAELRIVTYDPERQVTLIEMLHGHVRAHVTTITKASGSFEIRTPTARIFAVGTVITAETSAVDTTNAATGTVISQQVLDNLPTTGRNISSLSQLAPGVLPGSHSQSTMKDFMLVDGTGVTVEDHFASVMNLDPAVAGQVDLLPGEFTVIKQGSAPEYGSPMYSMGNDYSLEYKTFRSKYDFGYSSDRTRATDAPPRTPSPNRNPDCGRGTVINGAYVPLSSRAPTGKPVVIPKFRYEATGTTGISTGNALQIRFFNDSPCPLKFVVTNGAILRPTGFTGRVVEGFLLGTQPLKDYQKMYTIGGKVYLLPNIEMIRLAGPRSNGPNDEETASMAVPAGTEATMMLRSFCVEFHKLAPHPKSIYKFADAGDQNRYAPNRALVGRAFHMVLTHQIALPADQQMDSLVQWLLWKNIEGLNEKKFHEEFFGLVKRNYEAQKRKWDKAAERDILKMEQGLWNNIQKVLAAKD